MPYVETRLGRRSTAASGPTGDDARGGVLPSRPPRGARRPARPPRPLPGLRVLPRPARPAARAPAPRGSASSRRAGAARASPWRSRTTSTRPGAGRALGVRGAAARLRDHARAGRGGPAVREARALAAVPMHKLRGTRSELALRARSCGSHGRADVALDVLRHGRPPPPGRRRRPGRVRAAAAAARRDARSRAAARSGCTAATRRPRIRASLRTRLRVLAGARGPVLGPALPLPARRPALRISRRLPRLGFATTRASASPTRPGFRAGIAHPFRPWDVARGPPARPGRGPARRHGRDARRGALPRAPGGRGRAAPARRSSTGRPSTAAGSPSSGTPTASTRRPRAAGIGCSCASSRRCARGAGSACRPERSPRRPPHGFRERAGQGEPAAPDCLAGLRRRSLSPLRSSSESRRLLPEEGAGLGLRLAAAAGVRAASFRARSSCARSPGPRHAGVGRGRLARLEPRASCFAAFALTFAADGSLSLTIAVVAIVSAGALAAAARTAPRRFQRVDLLAAGWRRCSPACCCAASSGGPRRRSRETGSSTSPARASSRSCPCSRPSASSTSFATEACMPAMRFRSGTACSRWSARLGGVDVSLVVLHLSPLLVPLALVLAYAAGAALFASWAGGVAAAAGQAALVGFPARGHRLVRVHRAPGLGRSPAARSGVARARLRLPAGRRAHRAADASLPPRSRSRSSIRRTPCSSRCRWPASRGDAARCSRRRRRSGGGSAPCSRRCSSRPASSSRGSSRSSRRPRRSGPMRPSGHAT